MNLGVQHFEAQQPYEAKPSPTGQAHGGGEKFIDLAWLTALIWRHKWLMLGLVGGIVALTMIAYLFAEKVYEANVILALDRSEQQIVRTAQTNRDNVIDSPAVDTEVQVLLSPEIARNAVIRSRLNTDAAFLKAKVPDTTAPLSVEAATNLVRSGLKVERKGLSYAINLRYKSNDPEVSAMVANAVADAYVGGQVQAAQTARGSDIQMLRSRLDQLRGDVLRAEAAVAQYRARADLVSISDDDTIAQQELSTLNTELAAAKADLAAAQGRASANAGENGSVVNSSPVISDLRRQVATLEQKLAEQTSSLGPAHPDRVRTEANLAAARTALQREVARASSGVGQDVRVASQRVGAIQGAIGGARGRLLAGNNASVRLAELERVAESSRQLYQTFLDRYRVQLATRGTEKSKADIISRAQTPRLPSSPDILVYMIGGLAIGIVAAVGLALALEWRENGIRTRTEAEEFTGLKVISSLPDIATMDEPDFRKGEPLSVPDFLATHRESPFAETVRSIWTALRIGQKGQLAKTVGLTSSIPDEGKTSTAMALVRSAALAGRRTLLIDCDLRRMGTTHAFGLGEGPGLVEVLSGLSTLKEAVVVDQSSGAHVLPLNTTNSNNFDIVQSDMTAALLDHCKAFYDLIVLDIAPAIPVAEARAVAAMADVVLLVVRWRTTPKPLLKTALRELHRADANIFGLVLTQVDARSAAVLGEDMAYYQYYYARDKAPLPV
ncbi:GumC family protein [Novosphingobium panipatense]|uniref:non-specific protein-tyrosine kinase n=2 Tax=Novosphingobium panipatense TaxID=428991 RepID=A0ABY1QJT5_9SPHN|nr:polysaccharide biosynthesis tyrosine autokinase [Novosphingobium panipatense]SMP71892.1 capsular exopolysaccharide family [Novosphingobium panipatense]